MIALGSDSCVKASASDVIAGAGDAANTAQLGSASELLQQLAAFVKGP